MSSSNTENLESFLTIVKTISKNNNQPVPLHLKSLLGSHNKPETKNLKQTLEEAGNVFSDEQCACLFANIANLNFEDGRLKDRTLMQDAEKALRIDSSDGRDVISGIEKQFQTSRIFTNDEDWNVFCAGLIAIAHSDGEISPSEEAYIECLIPEKKHLDAGKEISRKMSLEELGNSFADLDIRQRGCLAAHSINLMLIDGEWAGSEQQYFELATEKMRLSRFEEERLLKGLWALHNLSVFA
tara:strand:+ start:2002 stop:2724 length:723 start_codon:yes stop_codon:yes gene_type:complete